MSFLSKRSAAVIPVVPGRFNGCRFPIGYRCFSAAEKLEKFLRFRDLPNVSPKSLRALEEVCGFDKLLPGVQQTVLPDILRTVTRSIHVGSEGGKDEKHSTLPPDCIVQAHTGTGKTICYLLPMLEQLALTERLNPNVSPGIKGLVIAPSRELAQQITDQLENLLTFWNDLSGIPRSTLSNLGPDRSPGFNVVSLVGGMSRKQDCQLIKRKKPKIVVGTPGRLIDHFEQTSLFHRLFEGMEVLVLDEVDKLCDEFQFLQQLKQLLAYLPDQKRTLMFSATVPENVRKKIVVRYLRGNAEYFDCIGTEEDSTTGNLINRGGVKKSIEDLPVTGKRSKKKEGVNRDEVGGVDSDADGVFAPTDKADKSPSVVSKYAGRTSSNITESAEILPPQTMLTCLYNVLVNEVRRKRHAYKVIVFFPTARMTQFAASLFRDRMRFNIHELHSRVSANGSATSRDQNYRAIVSNRFQRDSCGILFSSDVSSRGMDYKDVSLVVQFLAPGSIDQYVHRVGRTGRSDKTGLAHLILPTNQAGFIDRLAKEGIEIDPKNIKDHTLFEEGSGSDFFRNTSSGNAFRSGVFGSGTIDSMAAFSNGKTRMGTENTTKTAAISLKVQSSPVVAVDDNIVSSEALNAATSSWVTSASMQHLCSAAFASLLSHFKMYHRVVLDSHSTMASGSGNLQSNSSRTKGGNNVENEALAEEIPKLSNSILTGFGMLQTPCITQSYADSLGLKPLSGILHVIQDEPFGELPVVHSDPKFDQELRIKRYNEQRRGGRM